MSNEYNSDLTYNILTFTCGNLVIANFSIVNTTFRRISASLFKNYNDI